MDLKTTIDDLLNLYQLNPAVKSVGMGEIEEYSVDKGGFEYTRAYITLVEASESTLELTLTVTDKVTPQQDDRLAKQSSTLTLIKELSQMMIATTLIKYNDTFVFTPVSAFQEDATYGWQLDFTVQLNENIDVCNLIP